jgi:SNF2 family DNA or RNA helicase
MRALNGILVFRRTKAEPEIAEELPDQIDELDHCAMTPGQIGLYQAVLDKLVTGTELPEGEAPRKGQILAAITALKQICNHQSAYQHDRPLAGRRASWPGSEEIVWRGVATGERVLIFTPPEWGSSSPNTSRPAPAPMSRVTTAAWRGWHVIGSSPTSRRVTARARSSCR